MSTHKRDEFVPSDWTWVGPWLLFMSASAAFFTTDRGPIMTALLALCIVGAAYVCWVDQREQQKRERRE